MIIGLTGEIGAGKSTVAGILQDAGAVVIDADAIAREVILQGEVIQRLVEGFGEQILQEGLVNREKLAKVAFSTNEGTNRLNDIMHGAILATMQKQMEQYKIADCKIIVLDAPLLIETNLHLMCQSVFLVSAKRELRAERVRLRSGLTQEQLKAREDAQMDFEKKLQYADVLIYNHGDVENLKQDVLQKLYKVLQKEKSRS